jgi:cathepsin L
MGGRIAGVASFVLALIVQHDLAFTCAQAQDVQNSAQSNAPVQQRRARGGVAPENLDSIVALQNQATLASATVLRDYFASMATAKLSAHTVAPACSAQQASFDWRDLHKVTSVKDQGGCGSCWAFAAVSAYESSYLIVSGKNAPSSGPPAVSEQEALDCSSAQNSCQGGWPDKTYAYLVKPGETGRGNYPPYKAAQGVCLPIAARQYSALNWGFVAGATIPADDAIKTAICDHGPIVAGVKADHWDDAISPSNDNYKYSITQNPNFLIDFKDGVFVGAPSERNLTMATYSVEKVDHIVVIAGWDNSTNSWIIKNSWGTDWGNHGFMKLRYGTANIGFSAAWIDAKGSATPPSASIMRALEAVHTQFQIQDLAPTK